MSNKILASKVHYRHLLEHETKLHVFKRFLLVIFVFVAYFIFIAHRYGIEEGFFVLALTWSFFVFCTPIADAGFVLAFPARMLFGIRMLYTQLFSIMVALSLNLYAFFYYPSIYDSTVILKIFYSILSQPFPFWGIIILSLFGTMFSIFFGDEMFDVTVHTERKRYHKHKYKYRLLIIIFLFVGILVFYNILLNKLGIVLPSIV